MRKARFMFAVPIAIAVMPSFAMASALAVPTFTTTRVSVDVAGVEGNAASLDPEASNDGQFVVFESSASNLVAGDLNGTQDIFMKNTANGVVTRVSVSSTGIEANGASFDPAISSDAHFVVYSSDATNLIGADVNGFRDIFMFDTILATTKIISVGPFGQSNGASNHPKVSTDPVVAFDSVATNLIAADANGVLSDVFSRIVNSGTTRLISLDSAGVQGNDASTFPDITPSSNMFAFQSLATNLVAGDTNAFEDVFTHRNTGQTRRVSINSAGGQGNGPSARPDLSNNGMLIAFHSDATNLVVNDINARRDVFLRDAPAATTRMMSTRGAVRGNGDSSNPSITPTGVAVAFESVASNFVAGDGNASSDIFVRQVGTLAIARVSVDGAGVEGNGASLTAAASENGALQAVVSYQSVATNLVAGDANSASDVFQFRP